MERLSSAGQGGFFCSAVIKSDSVTMKTGTHILFDNQGEPKCLLNLLLSNALTTAQVFKMQKRTVDKELP